MTWKGDDYTMFVYALLDDDGLAIYVGITNDPRTRRGVHWRTASQPYRGRTPLRLWITDRKRHGLPLHMLVVEKVHGVKAARAREAAWIDFYLRAGRGLLNTCTMPKQPTLL